MNSIGFFEDLLETGRFLDCLFLGGGRGRGKVASLMIFLTIDLFADTAAILN